MERNARPAPFPSTNNHLILHANEYKDGDAGLGAQAQADIAERRGAWLSGEIACEALPTAARNNQ